MKEKNNKLSKTYLMKLYNKYNEERLIYHIGKLMNYVLAMTILFWIIILILIGLFR